LELGIERCHFARPTPARDRDAATPGKAARDSDCGNWDKKMPVSEILLSIDANPDQAARHFGFN
jgi:hypothetical protein